MAELGFELRAGHTLSEESKLAHSESSLHRQAVGMGFQCLSPCSPRRIGPTHSQREAQPGQPPGLSHLSPDTVIK